MLPTVTITVGAINLLWACSGTMHMIVSAATPFSIIKLFNPATYKLVPA